MALNRLLADLSIISKLGTNPGIDDGLSEEQIKSKFDEAANIIKDYLNNYLIVELDKTVDVEALLKDILDVTLSKTDKAANAAATGEAIRGLRSFFEKTVHSGDYVLESDGSLAAEISNTATIRVMGGEGVMQGNLFALHVGAYEDVELVDGTFGLRRNDLIVVRCTKDDTGTLSYALVALTGANTSGDPVDPEYIQSNINADGTVRDFPLYRVKFNGYDITEIEPLFNVETSLEKSLRKYVDSKNFTRSVALVADGWADNKQVVEVPGVTADSSKTDVYVSPDPEDANYTAYTENGVRPYSQGDGTITFKCEDVPGVNLVVNVAVQLVGTYVPSAGNLPAWEGGSY